MFALVEGLKVHYWPSRLSKSRCEALASSLPWDRNAAGGTILTDHKLAMGIATGLLPEDAPRVRWLDHVTLGHLVGGERENGIALWHVDPPHGARWKMCAYLDDAPGTIFGRTDQFAPPTPQGSVVLFDIRLEHRAAPMERGVVKRTVGLRAV